VKDGPKHRFSKMPPSSPTLASIKEKTKTTVDPRFMSYDPENNLNKGAVLNNYSFLKPSI